MPELAEVEFYRRIWNPLNNAGPVEVVLRANSRVFRGVEMAALESALCSGIVRSEARAKQMCFHLADGSRMGIHLGMAGRLNRLSPETPPETHEQIRILSPDGGIFTYRDTRYFGRVHHATRRAAAPWWDGIAPDLLSLDFRFADLDAFLSRRSRTPIKAVLLMQERFPGIGNWMADEILWRARIRPEILAGSLKADARKRIYRAIRFVCRGALDWIADRGEDPPSSSWLFRHRWRDGGQCPRCRQVLIRETVGGRTSCFCTTCQPPVENHKTAQNASKLR